MKKCTIQQHHILCTVTSTHTRTWHDFRFVLREEERLPLRPKRRDGDVVVGVSLLRGGPLHVRDESRSRNQPHNFTPRAAKAKPQASRGGRPKPVIIFQKRLSALPTLETHTQSEIAPDHDSDRPTQCVYYIYRVSPLHRTIKNPFLFSCPPCGSHHDPLCTCRRLNSNSTIAFCCCFCFSLSLLPSLSTQTHTTWSAYST